MTREEMIKERFDSMGYTSGIYFYNNGKREGLIIVDAPDWNKTKLIIVKEVLDIFNNEEMKKIEDIKLRIVRTAESYNGAVFYLENEEILKMAECNPGSHEDNSPYIKKGEYIFNINIAKDAYAVLTPELIDMYKPYMHYIYNVDTDKVDRALWCYDTVEEFWNSGEYFNDSELSIWIDIPDEEFEGVNEDAPYRPHKDPKNYIYDLVLDREYKLNHLDVDSANLSYKDLGKVIDMYYEGPYITKDEKYGVLY